MVNRRHLPSVAHGKVPQQESLPKSGGQGLSGDYRRVGDRIRRAHGSSDPAGGTEWPTMKRVISTVGNNRLKNVPEIADDQEDEMSIRHSEWVVCQLMKSRPRVNLP